MEYEKKYKEALERATQRWECGDLTREVLEYVFHELREDEDEKIRKAIIATIHLYYGEPLEDEAKEMISWIEKQGGKKPADKVEPKFQKGQWIVWLNKCYKVNYNGCGYELIDQMGLRTSLEYETVDESAHLWTIEDAKGGDVLASKDGKDILIFRNLDNDISFSSYYNIKGKGEIGWSNTSFIPATKEQRDTLIKAMVDAGYTFDLKKRQVI